MGLSVGVELISPTCSSTVAAAAAAAQIHGHAAEIHASLVKI